VQASPDARLLKDVSGFGNFVKIQNGFQTAVNQVLKTWKKSLKATPNIAIWKK
jgi:hypothetical protein